MAAPTVRESISNGDPLDASEVMTNFNGLVSDLTDGTKDLTINALTLTAGLSVGTTISLTGSNIAKTAAPVADTQYPNSILKARAFLTCGAAGSVTVSGGFNVNTSTYSTSVITVNFHTNLLDANYSVIPHVVTSLSTNARRCYVSSRSTSSVEITLVSVANSPSAQNWASGDTLDLMIFGDQ